MTWQVPYAVHHACWVEHTPRWPKFAKVWVAWGSFGWRPGIVKGHREHRVAVKVIDGLWPFDGSRLSRRPDKLTFVAPSTLRSRKDAKPPEESSSGHPGCVRLTKYMGAGQPDGTPGGQMTDLEIAGARLANAVGIYLCDGETSKYALKLVYGEYRLAEKLASGPAEQDTPQ